jgi:hypothetical protein
VEGNSTEQAENKIASAFIAFANCIPYKVAWCAAGEKSVAMSIFFMFIL